MKRHVRTGLLLACVLTACSLSYAQSKELPPPAPATPDANAGDPPPPGAPAEPGARSAFPPVNLSDLSSIETPSDADIKKAFSGPKYKKEVHRLNWNPKMGWNGLVVGKSKLADAVKKFGEAKISYEGPAEHQYYLVKAPVRLWVSDKTKTILAIEVYVSTQFAPQTPFTVRDAKIMYAPIEIVKEMEGCTIDTSLKRPGLSMDVENDGAKARVRTMFFSIPKSASEPNAL